MWYNNASCDIYIGRGAGKKLLEEISQAKSSVKIVSPYLSPALIDELIKLERRQIDIRLITTSTPEGIHEDYRKAFYKLIVQHKQTDQEALEARAKWQRIIKFLLYLIIFLAVSVAVLLYFLRDARVFLGLILVLLAYLAYQYLSRQIKNKQLYQYSYTKLFPFKVYIPTRTADAEDMPIHAKIYVIDSQVAYLGSLNFTHYGTKYNYESRVRTTDPKAVEEIEKEVDQLYYNAGLQEQDIQSWGSYLYAEPIN